MPLSTLDGDTTKQRVEYVCPRCDGIVAHEDSACPHCGQKLEVVATTEEEEAPAPVGRTEAVVGSACSRLPPQPAPLRRRLAAWVIDIVVLASGLSLVFLVGLSIGAESEITWVLVVWLGVVAPVYFALYHAYGTGATPGQLELRVGIRDAETGDLVSLRRALARAYGGVLAALLVLPLLADLAVLVGSRNGRAPHDRLIRSAAVRISLAGKAPELAEGTSPDLLELFESAAGGHYVRRAWSLARVRSHLVLRTVAVVYAGLIAVAALLAGLWVADLSAEDVSAGAYAAWVMLAVVLLVSGVYWTQSAVVAATEIVRVGGPASVQVALERAVRRTNALSAALILLLPVALLVVWFLPFVIVAARLTLVAPALVLEDTRVLGAFARSWQLTRRRTGRVLGLLFVSLGAMVGVAMFASALAGVSLGIFTGGDNALGIILSGIAALAIASAPVIYVMGVVGASWSLLYEDLRREAATRSDR
jgi:hypothetical protein